MSYKNILVIIDFSPVSQILVNKAVFIAKPYNSKIFLVQFTNNCSEIYNKPVDVNINIIPKQRIIDNNKIINEFKFKTKYSLISSLEYTNISLTQLIDVIKKYNLDLIIMGHYQDFWSKLLFKIRHFINSLQVDILIIPLSN